MNRQMIAFHSRIQAWGEKPAAEQMTNFEAEGVMPLSPQKFSQIETWRKEVNKNFQQSGHPRKVPMFVRLSAPTYQSTCPKTSGRGHKLRLANPHIKQRLMEGNLTSVATRLADISSHYSHNRKELHLNEPPLIKSMTVHNSGYQATEGTANTAAVSLDSSRHDLNCSISVSTRQRFKTEWQIVNHVVPTDFHEQTENQDDCNNLRQIEKTELAHMIRNVKHSEKNKTSDQSQAGKSDTSLSLDISSDLGISESEYSMSTSKELPQPVLAMKVANRSTSNTLLNVLSIDDCKIACRYRPCILKEKHEKMNCDWVNKKNVGEQEYLDRRAKNSTSLLTPSGESYGHNTVLYSNTESSSTRTPEKSARIRIKTAMDSMINDRKVMNKRYSSRIGNHGEPIIDRQEGSATFRRLNATLRKHIRDTMEEKYCEKMRIYEERRKKYKMKTCDTELISEELRKI